MDPLVQPIIALYGLSSSILATAIGDISDEDAKARSRGGTGPSIAWTVGHLCHSKIAVLALLGHSREHAAATDGANYPRLADLAASFSALNADLCGALASSADQLEAPMPGSGPHN